MRTLMSRQEIILEMLMLDVGRFKDPLSLQYT